MVNVRDLQSGILGRVADNWSVVLFVVLFSVFSFTFTLGDESIGFLSDDAVYLLLAEAYSPWVSMPASLSYYLQIENQFPPLYPLVLGFMGVTSDHPAIAQSITVVIYIIAVVVFVAWLKLETKNNRVTVLIASVFCLLPGSLILSQELWSEFLYILLLFGCCILFVKPPGGSKVWLYAALLVGLTTLTRSAGFTLLLVYIIWLVRYRPVRWYYFAGIAISPMAGWNIYKALIGARTGYFVSLLQQLSLDNISGLPAFFILQLGSLWKGWLWLLGIPLDRMLPVYICLIMSAILLILSIVGLIIRVHEKKFDAIHAVFYVLMLLVWPYTGEDFSSRFLFPVAPFLLFYVYYAMRKLVERYQCNLLLIAGLSITAILLLTIFPATAHLIKRGFETVDVSIAPYIHSRYWLTASKLQDAKSRAYFERDLYKSFKLLIPYIPEGDCVYSVHPPFVMLNLKRKSILLPTGLDSDKSFEDNTSVCNYILAMRLRTANYDILYPMNRRIIKDKYSVVTIQTGEEGPDDRLLVLAIRNNPPGAK